MSATDFTIGIDVRAALRGPCGIGRCSIELARALLEADASVRVLLYGASRRGRARARALPEELLANPRARLFAPRLPATAVAALARLPGFRTERFTGPLDVFLHTDLVYVAGLRCPQIVVVHDLAFEVSREFHDPGFHATVRERMKAAIARARAVIAPSASTRAELAARWGVDPARVSVIAHGSDHLQRVARGARRDPRPDPRRGYLLHVGTLEPRKNLARLVRAFRDARARGLGLDLVLAGARGWRCEELDAELARDRDGSILVRGAVDEPELRAWLEDATALVYPSLHEGFGLPIVEAFAAGVPVVTSDRSATGEIGAGAALLVDPESETAIAGALLRVASDRILRDELARRGLERARELTWARCARATLELCRAAAAEPPPGGPEATGTLAGR